MDLLSTIVLCFSLLLAGCAAPPRAPVDRAPFTFAQDTFSYANELVWEYGYDAEGKWTASAREPKPGYTHRCFVVARSALQFYHHAEFVPHLPVSDEAAYRKRIRQVVKRSPRRAAKPGERILIPGYSNLSRFSQAQSELLRKNCGGPWQSYFQRGHWRMLFPFPRKQQAATAERLLRWVNEGRPVVIHVVRFPKLSINHALVVYAGTRTADGIDFAVYDPNDPEKPERLRYVQTTRTFCLPRNDYFIGGRLDVYPVFHNWAY